MRRIKLITFHSRTAADASSSALAGCPRLCRLLKEGGGEEVAKVTFASCCQKKSETRIIKGPPVDTPGDSRSATENGVRLIVEYSVL